ncbi:hypothetical protein [Clostridium scatologenes]|uniref:Uncharacterized protein n=1 Tax=Clostridium scatologenes TaxID=1548 RepID=A0A0E3JZP5_CLOSL|nr:hypothetical protein [Clostridium scatologenes]AKA68514.1 hypothetical protein CSCA_1389 [Clostridium scatologenes]
MNKKIFLEELEFVKNPDAEIEIVDKEGNLYGIEDFGTNEESSHISILIKKQRRNKDDRS